MDHSHDHDQHDDHHAHGGLGKYIMVFIALCVLTTCSFLTIQPWWPLEKAPTWIFMMGVSSIKAMLVIMVFMHLTWEANWKYVLTIPAGMMSMYLVLMLIPDIGNRLATYSEQRTIHSAEIVEMDHGGHHAEDGGHGHDGQADGSHDDHTEDGHDDHASDEDHGGH